MAITFLNPETMTEENGKFIKYVGPFKARVKSNLTGKVFVVDIDDFWTR